MTKRILALVLVCILAIPIFTVTASAASVTGDTDYDNWRNLYVIASYIERVSDVMLSSISSTLDSIDGWCDTLWQEIRNQRIWQETTLGTALDTINDNIIAFNGNVDLWIEAQTTVLLESLGGITDNVKGFWDGFLLWWEDFNTFTSNWNAKMTSLFNYLFNTANGGGFLVKIHSNIATLLNGSTSAKNQASEFEEQVTTEATEFQENMEAIDEWTRPDYESEIILDQEYVTGGYDIGTYTNSLKTVLYGPFNDGSIFFVTFIAFTFSAISFVVFGKR